MNELFEAVDFAGLSLKNHFIRSATWENMADENGHLTKELYQIYEELAKGQVGLIITGCANILKEEKCLPGMMGIYDDSFLEEYQRLTELVHRYGSKTMMQISYGGTRTTYQTAHRKIYAPDSIPEISTGTRGVPMTTEDIDRVVDAYAEAAERVMKAGFDGVALHGAHNYLINQFLSPYYNRRTDEYGGSLENRMRFLDDIYYAIRKKVGRDFPIIIKLTASDFMSSGFFVSGQGEVVQSEEKDQHGLTFEEVIKITRHLERIGMSAIEISGNIHAVAHKLTGNMLEGCEIKQHGYFTEYARRIADEMNIPVIVVGGLDDIAFLEETISKSRIRFFAFCRALLAEPSLISRWQSGDRAPAKCLHCSNCRKFPDVNYCTVFGNNPRSERITMG